MNQNNSIRTYKFFQCPQLKVTFFQVQVLSRFDLNGVVNLDNQSGFKIDNGLWSSLSCHLKLINYLFINNTRFIPQN